MEFSSRSYSSHDCKKKKGIVLLNWFYYVKIRFSKKKRMSSCFYQFFGSFPFSWCRFLLSRFPWLSWSDFHKGSFSR
jgi:hypothetical protein